MSKQPMSAGKIVGITCGSLLGVFVLLPMFFSMVAFGGVSSTSILPLLGVGLILYYILRNRKKKNELPVQVVAEPVRAVSAQKPTTSSYVGGDIPTTVCQHSFNVEDLTGKTTITCPCGYKFKTKDLLDYQKLSADYLRIEEKLMAVRQRLVASTTTATPVAAARTAAPAVEVAPKVRKAKSTLSLQQWLIMGASAIIVVAGSIFVSTNLNSIEEEGFLLITLGVSVVTGFLAFWGRKFSVMLANFMATFSSAMLMFAILVSGDILNESFTWETAPAWFWSLDLLVISVVSFVLARFKANFGWKIISLAGLAASAVVFMIGELANRTAIISDSFAWFCSTATVGAVLVALASKQVSAIKFKLDKGTPDLEYEKDLAKREDEALQKFTLFSAAAFVLLGVGYLVMSMVQFVVNVEPVSFTVFALVSVLALVTRSLWVDALGTEKKVAERISSSLHVYAYTTVALSLSNWIFWINPSNYWLGVFATAIIMFGSVALGFYVKKIGEHPIAIQVAQFALAGAWLVWYSGAEKEVFEYLAAFGILLVAFGLSLVLQSWLGAGRRSLVLATVFHFIGLGFLFLSVTGGSGIIFSTLESRVAFPIYSIEYAFVTLGIILLAAAYSPLTALVNKKLGEAYDSASQMVIFILTTLITALLSFRFQWEGEITSLDEINLASALAGAALVTGLLAAVTAGKNSELSKLVLRYSYAFQGILAFKLWITDSSNESLLVTGIALGVLAAVNYGISWIGKIKSSVWLAYGFSLAGLLIVEVAQRDELLVAAHLALVIVTALALNFVLRIVDKRVSEKYTTYFSLISVFGLSVASIGINIDKWTRTADSTQIYLGLGTLVLVAVLSAGAAELKTVASERIAIALRVTGLAYLFLAFTTLAGFDMLEGLKQEVGLRRIALAALFAVIVFRQLRVSSSAKSETTNGWFALGYLAPATLALIASDLLTDAVDLDKFNLELYTVPLAIAFALPTLFHKSAEESFRRLVGMDIPLLFPVAASAIYSLSQNIDEEATVYRLVVSTAILALYSWFRFSKAPSILWAALEYTGLVGFGLSLAQLVEVLAPDLLDGPDLFGLGAAAAIVAGNINLKKVIDFKSSLFSYGLPLFTLVLPSIIHTYTTLDISIQLTSPTQITRILIVLVISLLALILGVRNGNLGTAVAGGASLSLLILPITWASAGQSSDYETTVALRALGISLFLFLFLGGLRSINKLPDSSYLYLGIPSVVALGPSLYLTLSSIGNSSLTEVDWWRFGILMVATVTLLVVGALRSLGGLFFPGLVGVIVGVLPYAFQPIARESWFLWVVLLVIAAVMVWIAVRLEQLRKLGKSSASWIKSLK